MPRLLLFVPCQRAIVDGEDNALSLFNVLEGLTFGLVADSMLRPTDVVPFQWMVLTLWVHEPDDRDATYEQRIEVIRPDGTTFVTADLAFQVTHRTHRNRVALTGMPVGQDGEYTLRLSLRRLSTDDSWERMAEYPLAITHNTEAGPQPAW